MKYIWGLAGLVMVACIGAYRTVKVPGQRIIMLARQVCCRKILVLIIFIRGCGDSI